MDYYNAIKKENTIYPFRFKTEYEFLNEFGTNWRQHVAWGNTNMDNLLGKDFEKDPNLKNENDIFINTDVLYNGNYYVEYKDDEKNMDWYICELMITKNNKIPSLKNIYLKNSENIYENNQNIFSSDIFYRFIDDDDKERILKLLEKMGFNNNLSIYDKILVVSFYKNGIPDYATNEVELYGFRVISDDELIKKNIEYNNGDYIFAKSVDELFFHIKNKNVTLNSIINKRKNIYENTEIIRYSDFENIEYRKGSKEFGGIITKLLEFLRLYNTQEDLVFKIGDFIKKSNITIEEIEKLQHSKEIGQKLYDFEIIIDKNNIMFKNLNKTGKNRPFESNNN